MTRSRRWIPRVATIVLLAVTAGSCSFLANEFILLDSAGPVAAPAHPPSGLQERP